MKEKLERESKTPEVWSTIHIFGYGETQIIGDKLNHKAQTSTFATAVTAVIENIFSKKPADSTLTSIEYHAINIFHNMFSDFQPKESKGFRVKHEDLDAALIEALANEVIASVPPATA